MPLTNNDIMKKLRVAHKLRDTDIVDICGLVDFAITKSEIGAIYRNPEHPKFMECGDQFLRNFLNGLIIHLRGPMPAKGETKPDTIPKPKLKPKSNLRPKPNFKTKQKPKPKK